MEPILFDAFLCRIYVALRSITVAQLTASAEPGGANLAPCRHTMRQEAAALRDFWPAYVRFGS